MADEPAESKSKTPREKNPTSFRLYPDTLRRIDRLAAELHVDKSSVVELAIRALWKREEMED